MSPHQNQEGERRVKRNGEHLAEESTVKGRKCKRKGGQQSSAANRLLVRLNLAALLSVVKPPKKNYCFVAV